MRINLGTVEVTERERVALALLWGRTGKADRDEVRNFLREHGAAKLERIAFPDSGATNAEINRRMGKA